MILETIEFISRELQLETKGIAGMLMFEAVFIGMYHSLKISYAHKKPKKQEKKYWKDTIYVANISRYFFVPATLLFAFMGKQIELLILQIA